MRIRELIQDLLTRESVLADYLVVWEGDEGVSVVSGDLIKSDDSDRTVGALCSVQTSLKGAIYKATIAGCGKSSYYTTLFASVCAYLCEVV